MMTILIIVFGLFALLGISGVFETWIIKECTSCGKKGKLKSLCHLYEAIANNLQPSIVGYKFRLGVIHRSILCKDCYEEVVKKVQRIIYGKIHIAKT